MIIDGNISVFDDDDDDDVIEVYFLFFILCNIIGDVMIILFLS